MPVAGWVGLEPAASLSRSLVLSFSGAAFRLIQCFYIGVCLCFAPEADAL